MLKRSIALLLCFCLTLFCFVPTQQTQAFALSATAVALGCKLLAMAGITFAAWDTISDNIPWIFSHYFGTDKIGDVSYTDVLQRAADSAVNGILPVTGDVVKLVTTMLQKRIAGTLLGGTVEAPTIAKPDTSFSYKGAVNACPRIPLTVLIGDTTPRWFLLILYSDAACTTEVSRMGMAFFNTRGSGWDLYYTRMPNHSQIGFSYCAVSSIGHELPVKYYENPRRVIVDYDAHYPWLRGGQSHSEGYEARDVYIDFVENQPRLNCSSFDLGGNPISSYFTKRDSYPAVSAIAPNTDSVKYIPVANVRGISLSDYGTSVVPAVPVVVDNSVDPDVLVGAWGAIPLDGTISIDVPKSLDIPLTGGAVANSPPAVADKVGTVDTPIDWTWTKFFDSPKNFKLNFDGFKNIILPDRFPFCIPFDAVDSIKMFAATAKDYNLKFDIDSTYLKVHHTVDLAPFIVPLALFRYLSLAFFTWSLILRTRDLIKW